MPPFFRTGRRPALAALFLVVAASLFAADDEDTDEEVEPVVVPPLIDTTLRQYYAYGAEEWRDSTIERSLVAPYRVERAGQGRASVEFLKEEDAPKHMTFFGKGPRTWVGVRRKLRRVCLRHCEDSLETDCFWEGVYAVPGAVEPTYALAGRLALRDVVVPEFRPAPSDVPDCQDAVWGLFRSRICQEKVVLAYDRAPLLVDYADYNVPSLRMSHVFRHGQIVYHLVEFSTKAQHIRGLLYLTPLGWVLLKRGIEPPERAEICC